MNKELNSDTPLTNKYNKHHLNNRHDNRKSQNSPEAKSVEERNLKHDDTNNCGRF